MHPLTLVAACLYVSGLQGWCAAAGAPPTLGRPGVATNYVLVTNIVVVTNYVVTTNLVLTTNSAPTVKPTSALPPLSWVPPPDSYDWIQLKTGEWLKGRLQAMQERKLDFDSEKLKDLSFDWKDIRQVRSPRMLDIWFTDGEMVSGPVTITPEQIVVGGAEARVRPRSELQSLTPGGSRRNYWSGNASLGLTFRAGNTDQIEYDAQAHLQRRSPTTRLSLDYIGYLSSIDDVESANNHRVNAEFDLWLTRRFYLITPFAEYYRDPFQNLAYRLTVGAGVGYDLIARPNLNWNITTGPAFQKAWFESSQPGEPNQKSVAALAFGSRFEWDITQRVELILEYAANSPAAKSAKPPTIASAPSLSI